MDAQAQTAVRRASTAYASAILALIVATIAGAWAFQAAGIAPCELCLKERVPYYVGIVLAAAIWGIEWRGPPGAIRWGFALIAVVFTFSAAFGAYHAGVEWGFWPGPTDCTGTVSRAASTADFLHQLQTTRVVRCDAAAIRILGVSLAGWNAFVSIGVVAMAVAATVGVNAWSPRRPGADREIRPRN